jgi:opacity protein-like surface antigen
MKVTLRLATGLVTLAVLASPASAQDFYGSIFGGGTSLSDTPFSGTIGGSPQSVDTDFDDGYNIGIAVGRNFGTVGSNIGLRGEVELSFSENDVAAIDFSGNGAGTEANTSGSINSTRIFVNGYLDFANDSAITPFIGAGIGSGSHNINAVYGPGVTLNDDDTTFSTQLIAGVDYAINDTVSIFGDVRYIVDYDFESERFNPAGGSTGFVNEDLESTAINVGVRWRF